MMTERLAGKLYSFLWRLAAMLRMNDFQIMQVCVRCEKGDSDGRTWPVLWAEELFDSALIRARWGKIWRYVVGKKQSLANLDLAHYRLRNSYEAGNRIVPIKQIRGTEGREADFDASFYPLNKHNRSRWVNIAAAKYTGAEMPPVKLIQVGEEYYVRDGHHRISVARAFGEEAIDAEVIVWEVEENMKAEGPAWSCYTACEAV
jgi:hypothetical protein